MGSVIAELEKAEEAGKGKIMRRGNRREQRESIGGKKPDIYSPLRRKHECTWIEPASPAREKLWAVISGGDPARGRIADFADGD